MRKDYIMEIKGKFFAVGHGLTYAFKIDSFHVLFDIKKNCDFDELRDFYGNKNIDILVISHFDTDHSDGIQELYKQGFTMKRIYIPYIDDDEKLVLELMFLYFNRDYNSEREALGNTEIIEVRELEIYKTDFWEFNIHNSKEKEKRKGKGKVTGTPSADVAKIIKSLNAIGITTKDDVRRNLKAKQDDIKAAYKNVKGDLNLTSLFMEHGPIDEKSIKESTYSGLEFKSKKVKKGKNDYVHSLITGDCNLLNNKSVIKGYLNKLGYVLVPHHSGLKEWDDYICQDTDKVVWIVTISQIKSRPYGQVVSDIYSNNEELYICDKTKFFEYELISII